MRCRGGACQPAAPGPHLRRRRPRRHHERRPLPADRRLPCGRRQGFPEASVSTPSRKSLVLNNPPCLTTRRWRDVTWNLFLQFGNEGSAQQAGEKSTRPPERVLRASEEATARYPGREEVLEPEHLAQRPAVHPGTAASWSRQTPWRLSGVAESTNPVRSRNPFSLPHSTLFTFPLGNNFKKCVFIIRNTPVAGAGRPLTRFSRAEWIMDCGAPGREGVGVSGRSEGRSPGGLAASATCLHSRASSSASALDVVTCPFGPLLATARLHVGARACKARVSRGCHVVLDLLLPSPFPFSSADSLHLFVRKSPALTQRLL